MKHHICSSTADECMTLRKRFPQDGPDHRHNISFSCDFWVDDRLAGNLTFTSTIISPLSPGFLLFGIPNSGYRIVCPGCVGPAAETSICFPSIVVIVLFQPVNAPSKSISTAAIKSSPSLLKMGCSFCSESQHRCFRIQPGFKRNTSVIMKCRSCVPPSS